MYKTNSPELKYFDTMPELQNYATLHEVKKEQIFFYKDHLPYGLFILLSGEVEIIYDSKNSVIVEQKAFLGFDSFLNKKPYSVTAKALTDCKVYFLSCSDYQVLSGKNKTLFSWINNTDIKNKNKVQNSGKIKKSPVIVKDDKLVAFKKSLPENHLIYIMISEHEKILELLDELFNINQNIGSFLNYYSAKTEFEKLSELIEKFIKTELHHQREELVLFPILEEQGLFSDTFIMKSEHYQIRHYLEELKTIIQTIDEKRFSSFRKRIKIIMKFLLVKLTEIINEENYTIYPEAVKVITDKEIWLEMKKKSDEIGYFEL